MKKTILIMVSVLLVRSAVLSQSSGFSEILTEIESHNKSLQAYAGYMEANALSDKEVNTIDPLALDALYLPFGNNSSPQYVEVQVSQEFDFPSVYRTRSDYNEQLKLAREAAYRAERQDILTEALGLCTRLVYLQKREAVERERVDRARRLYDKVQEMFDREQIGRLELNKARVTWLQDQFTMEAIAAERIQLLEALRGLNGGIPVEYSEDMFTVYNGSLAVPSLDSLWQEKQNRDPHFLLRKEHESAALKNISVTRKERLPQFGIGLNYQGFQGDNYAGFSGGLSLPVWRNKSKMQAAEAAYVYELGETDAQTATAESNFRVLYSEYSALLSRYSDYEATLSALESEALLQRAFELGHLNYLQYYMERNFYRDAYDELLRMEVELYELKNQLLKHQL